eukprot:3448093-Pleurochrysis_carterae.AAC.1
MIKALAQHHASAHTQTAHMCARMHARHTLLFFRQRVVVLGLVRQVQSPVAKQMNRMRCNEKNVVRQIVKRQRYFDKYGCGMRAVSD